MYRGRRIGRRKGTCIKRVEKTMEAEGASVVRSGREGSSKRPAEAKNTVTNLGRQMQMQDFE